MFNENLIARFGSRQSQFLGRTFYQSRIWSSTHERAAPAFERTLSSRSLNSRSLNNSMFINNSVCRKYCRCRDKLMLDIILLCSVFLLGHRDAVSDHYFTLVTSGTVLILSVFVYLLLSKITRKQLQ